VLSRIVDAPRNAAQRQAVKPVKLLFSPSFFACLMRTLFLLALAAGTLASCHKKCQDPQPGCVGGTIVAFTCMDGPLINVDARYRIGAPGVLFNGRRVGNNVIAVVNADALVRPDSVGQRVYFTYVNDPSRQSAGMMCLAADGTQQPVPHLVLSNVSATGCGEQLAN
jgi:hypothetical protein